MIFFESIANEIDGDDFFDLEYSDIYAMIPKLKLRKKFIKAWSKVTKFLNMYIKLND